MLQDAERDDTERCSECGGGMAAMHMLTRTYDIGRGGWLRRIADFVEDVAVVCKDCGQEAVGHVEVREDTFFFVRKTPGQDSGGPVD